MAVPVIFKGAIVEITAENPKTGSKVIAEETSRSKGPWGDIFGKQNLKYLRQTSKSPKHKTDKSQKKSHDMTTEGKNKCLHNKHTIASSSKIHTPKKPVQSAMSNVLSILVKDQAVQCKMSDVSGNNFDKYDLSLESFATMKKKLNKLIESNKHMNTIHESLILERKILQSKLQEQNTFLNETNEKLATLEDQTKALTQEVEKATQAIKNKDETISKLKQQIKKDEVSEKLISDLRADLDKKTEITSKLEIKNKCLTLENEKFSTLLTYNKELITNNKLLITNMDREWLSTTKKQLTNIVHANEGNVSSQFSNVQTGLACSSPNSSSSDHPNISLSSIESQEHGIQNKNAIVDSAHFISLLGESSANLMPDSYKSQSTNHETIAHVKNNSVHHGTVNDHNKDNVILSPKAKKFSKFKRSLSNSNKIAVRHNSSKIPTGTAFNEPELSNTKQLVQNIFDDMQNRIPVDVPSPLRKYPRPNWSDSSLSSVSLISDLDIISSNNI